MADLKESNGQLIMDNKEKANLLTFFFYQFLLIPYLYLILSFSFSIYCRTLFRVLSAGVHSGLQDERIQVTISKLP